MKYIIIGLLTSILLTSHLQSNEYPQTFIVNELDKEADILYLKSFNGDIYTYYGVEDWFEGDIASAIMNDNGTPDDITDDKIIDLRYDGYIE